MNRFLGLVLMLMSAGALLLSGGCSNKLPTASTAAVASSSPATKIPVGYNLVSNFRLLVGSPINDYDYYTYGVAVLPDGDLVVTDDDYYAVYVLSPNNQPSGWGTSTSYKSIIGYGTIGGLYDVYTDNSGNIWVPDRGKGQVEKFSTNNKLLLTVGQYGTTPANGNLYNPDGVAFDGQGNIYVADEYLSVIQKYDPSGHFIATIVPSTKVNEPEAIACDGNYLYEADLGGHLVQKFTLKGNLAGNFGNYGTGPGQFESPSGVALDPQGNLIVCDSNNGVQKFNSNFVFQTFVGTGSEFYYPTDGPWSVATDSRGNVYAGDNNESWIYKFSPK